MIAAWILHTVYSTAIAFVLAHIFGALTPWIAVVSLLVGTYFGVRHSRLFASLYPDWKISPIFSHGGGVVEIAVTCFVLYAAVRHFMWMLFPLDANLATLCANNFGDLPLHINFIRAISGGVPFPVKNPIFASELLHYPYGPDLYNALWEILGIRLPAHLFLTGMFATVASVVLLRSYAGWWGIGAFFLSGGIAGLGLIFGQHAPGIDYYLQWKNLFLAVFVTQRGMLFAVPIGLMLLIATRRHFTGEAKLSKAAMTVLGVVWAFLPLFHLHAFVIVSLMMLAAAFESAGVRAMVQLLCSRMALVAYLPAIFFVLASTSFLQKAGVVHISLGWTAPKGIVPFFLVVNFGFWLLLPVAIAISLLLPDGLFSAQEKRRSWTELAIDLALFALFFNVMLAPWDWDNIKLLIWPFLGIARVASVTLEPRLQGPASGAVVKPIFAILLFASSFFTILGSLRSTSKSVVLYSSGEIANVQGAIETIPMSAVFAAAPTHNHPITFFGRMRAVGYDGHLWSHGIKAEPNATYLKDLMNGKGDWRDLIKKLGINYIYWGPTERLTYGDERKPWMDDLHNVSRVKGFEVYAAP